jgi:hypothetical protein
MKPQLFPIASINALFVLLLVGLVNDLHAQESVAPIFIPVNQIRFAGKALLTEKLQLHNVGAPILTSKPGLGVEGTITYSRHLVLGFRLNVGVSTSIIPFNFGYHFTDANGTLHTTRGITWSHIQWLNAIPITVQKTFALRPDQKWQLAIESGIRLNYTESGPATYRAGTSESESYPYLELRYERPDQKRYLSYTFKAGVMRHGAKGNAIHCNVVYHYSQENIKTGTYAFHNLGYDSFGNIEHRAGSAGLEFGYSLGILGNRENR